MGEQNAKRTSVKAWHDMLSDGGYSTPVATLMNAMTVACVAES